MAFSLSHRYTSTLSSNIYNTLRTFSSQSQSHPLLDYYSTLHAKKLTPKLAIANGFNIPNPIGRRKPIHVETSACAVSNLIATIKNCIENGLPNCTVPHTSTTHGILRCLLSEGMIRGFKYSHDAMGFDVYLKYLNAPTLGGASAEAAIHGAQMLSRPTLPLFVNAKALKLMTKQYHPAIFMIRTAKGIKTHNEALRSNMGGEVICRFL